MSRFLIYLVTGVITTGLATSFLPWWTVIIIAGIIGWWAKLSLFQSFLIGLLSVFVSWIFYAIIQSTGSFISPSIAIGDLIGGLPAWMGYILTGLVGGIPAGFSSLTGRMIAKIIRPVEDERILASSSD